MFNDNDKCPCGNNSIYIACCGRFIENGEYPETAEQLMRSRYSAYTRANIDYIEKTMCGPAAKGFNKAEALQWAISVKWLGLKVLEYKIHPIDPNKATVKFKANYSTNGQNQILTETSKFRKIDKQWLYVDGKSN